MNTTIRLLRAVTPVFLALALLLLLHSAALACPGCKDAVAANDPEKARLARGYFWSIIFMLSMPPAILCTLGGYFYYEVRRARAEKARFESQRSRVESQK